MSNSISSFGVGLAAVMLKAAIRRFIDEHPTILATFRMETNGDVRVDMADYPFAQTYSVFTSVVLTPNQQLAACMEFLKITGPSKDRRKNE